MIILDKYKISETFNGEDGESLTVGYDNRGGESYSEGASFEFQDGTFRTSVFLDGLEIKKLYKLLRDLIHAKKSELECNVDFYLSWGLDPEKGIEGWWAEGRNGLFICDNKILAKRWPSYNLAKKHGTPVPCFIGLKGY